MIKRCFCCSIDVNPSVLTLSLHDKSAKALLAICLQVLETGDVIAFYNRIFVPAVKADLMKLNQDRASLPLPPVPESLQGASPMRSYSRQYFHSLTAHYVSCCCQTPIRVYSLCYQIDAIHMCTYMLMTQHSMPHPPMCAQLAPDTACD